VGRWNGADEGWEVGLTGGRFPRTKEGGWLATNVRESATIAALLRCVDLRRFGLFPGQKGGA